MGWRITVEPTSEPVTLDELRTHLRVDSAFDSELTRLITAARKTVEAYLHRQLINATYAWSFDYWPDYSFQIPVGPLSSVTSITYYDANSTQQTWAASNYQVDTTELLGTITLAANATYPILQTDKKNAITITFVAGYGSSASSVPDNIKQAILVMAGHWFETTTPAVTGTIATEIPMHLTWMLNPDLVAETY